MSRPELGTEDEKPESSWERTLRIAKENPTVTVGTIGFFGIAYWQIRNFRRRPKGVTPTEHFFYSRVYAQGFLVYCLCAGMLVNIGRFYYKKWHEKPAESSGDTVAVQASGNK